MLCDRDNVARGLVAHTRSERRLVSASLTPRHTGSDSCPFSYCRFPCATSSFAALAAAPEGTPADRHGRRDHRAHSARAALSHAKSNERSPARRTDSCRSESVGPRLQPSLAALSTRPPTAAACRASAASCRASRLQLLRAAALVQCEQIRPRCAVRRRGGGCMLLTYSLD